MVHIISRLHINACKGIKKYADNQIVEYYLTNQNINHAAF